MMYRVCPICGCSLDPGEKCDCAAMAEYHKKMKELEATVRNLKVQKLLLEEKSGQMRLVM